MLGLCSGNVYGRKQHAKHAWLTCACVGLTPTRIRPHADNHDNTLTMQALQDAGHFAALGCGAEVQQEVLGKQLQAFNTALAGVHAAL